MMTVQKGSSGIQWITKQKAYLGRSSSDVSLSIIKNTGRQSKALSVIFRDKVWMRFGNNKYVIVGIDGAKLCFMPTSDGSQGYTLCDNVGNFNRYVKLGNPTLVEWARNRIGDYKLEYDKDGKFWYIDTAREA